MWRKYPPTTIDWLSVYGYVHACSALTEQPDPVVAAVESRHGSEGGEKEEEEERACNPLVQQVETLRAKGDWLGMPGSDLFFVLFSTSFFVSLCPVGMRGQVGRRRKRSREDAIGIAPI